MQRIHLYLKVTLDVDDDDRPEKLGTEICRQIKKVYGVRAAEVTNLTTEHRPDGED